MSHHSGSSVFDLCLTHHLRLSENHGEEGRCCTFIVEQQDGSIDETDRMFSVLLAAFSRQHYICYLLLKVIHPHLAV